MALYSKMLVRKATRFGTDALEQNIRNVIKEKTNKTGQHYSGTPHLCTYTYATPRAHTHFETPCEHTLLRLRFILKTKHKMWNSCYNLTFKKNLPEYFHNKSLHYWVILKQDMFTYFTYITVTKWQPDRCVCYRYWSFLRVGPINIKKKNLADIHASPILKWFLGLK